jgi:hypothetical protein
MSISQELMLAILSMDAYNRGYGAGISDGNHIIDGVDHGLGDAIDTQIGTATITSFSSSDPNSEAVAAGFYAVAYEWNGETVISYRGTDTANPAALASDIGGRRWIAVA